MSLNFSYQNNLGNNSDNDEEEELWYYVCLNCHQVFTSPKIVQKHNVKLHRTKSPKWLVLSQQDLLPEIQLVRLEKERRPQSTCYQEGSEDDELRPENIPLPIPLKIDPCRDAEWNDVDNDSSNSGCSELMPVFNDPTQLQNHCFNSNRPVANLPNYLAGFNGRKEQINANNSHSEFVLHNCDSATKSEPSEPDPNCDTPIIITIDDSNDSNDSHVNNGSSGPLTSQHTQDILNTPIIPQIPQSALEHINKSLAKGRTKTNNKKISNKPSNEQILPTSSSSLPSDRVLRPRKQQPSVVCIDSSENEDDNEVPDRTFEIDSDSDFEPQGSQSRPSAAPGSTSTNQNMVNLANGSGRDSSSVQPEALYPSPHVVTPKALLTRPTYRSDCGVKSKLRKVKRRKHKGGGGEEEKEVEEEIRFSQEQLMKLEKEFQAAKKKKLSRFRRLGLAKKLHLSVDEIKAWFQNRRRKEEKEIKEILEANEMIAVANEHLRKFHSIGRAHRN